MTDDDNISITFKPSGSGLEKFFGKLEAEVIDIVWENAPVTIKRVLYFLNVNHDCAYTTVMTVMNRLVNKERSIVTDIPGTTRDFIEDSFIINGVPVVLTDTAGIHDNPDIVATASAGLGDAMKGLDIAKIPEEELLQTRGW